MRVPKKWLAFWFTLSFLSAIANKGLRAPPLRGSNYESRVCVLRFPFRVLGFRA